MTGGKGVDVVLNSFTDTDDDHALAAEINSEYGVTSCTLSQGRLQVDMFGADVMTTGRTGQVHEVVQD